MPGFQRFDSSTPAAKPIKFSWSRFSRTKVILAVTTLALVTLVAVFAGLYGHAEHRLSKRTSTSTSGSEAISSTGTSMNTSRPSTNASETTPEKQDAQTVPPSSACTTPRCLQISARVLKSMNLSVDPCDDFYEYACGNYDTANSLSTNSGHWGKLVTDDIAHENKERIIKILEDPFPTDQTRGGAEQKVRSSYNSCMNQTNREAQRGKSLIKQLLEDIGGWNVLDGWDIADWDLNTAVKKVQMDLTARAFYRPEVVVLDGTPTIWIHESGLSQYIQSIDEYEDKEIMESYKRLIRTVGSYLIRDSGNETDGHQNLLDDFVNDITFIESKLAYYQWRPEGYYSDPDFDPYSDEYYMYSPKPSHIENLNDFWGEFFNWTEHMEYLFGSNAVNKDTSITVTHLEYLFRVTWVIDMELGSGEEQARKLNNYLVWRVAEAYLRALSWDYEYALTTFLRETRNYSADDFNYQEICFDHVKQHMPDAINFLFLREHFYHFSKEEAENLTDSIMLATQSLLETTPLMDDETRKIAKEKLDNIVFKIGFPDWVANQTLVDQLYDGLAINQSDFFGNMLGLQRYHWRESTKILTGADTTHEWWGRSRLYYLPEMWKDGSEIVAYAGLLQPPIYSKDQPYSLTFGSLGTQMALYLLQTVDDYQSQFTKSNWTDDDGISWWTNKTMSDYDKNRQCIANVYSNFSKEQPTPELTNGTQTQFNASYYADLAIIYTSSIRVALEAYKDWLKSKNMAEEILPGLNLNNEQLVLLSYAQRHCFSCLPFHSFSLQTEQGLKNDAAINLGLGQLSEFSNVFQCKAGSAMNQAEKCYYF